MFVPFRNSKIPFRMRPPVVLLIGLVVEDVVVLQMKRKLIWKKSSFAVELLSKQ